MFHRHRDFVVRDRIDAGNGLADVLATRLSESDLRDAVLLALPRGGVPVAFQIASKLHLPLDVICVRKLGLPQQPELAMGAISEGGFVTLNDDVVQYTTESELKEVERKERAELERRTRVFRSGREPPSLVGKIAVIVDDGIATGATARVACKAAKKMGARRVVLAVPVAPTDTIHDMARKKEADDFVVLAQPHPFGAIGNFYENFDQTEDSEVISLLSTAAQQLNTTAAVTTKALQIDVGHGVHMDADLTLPKSGNLAPAVVMFAHGSGSSRHSPRNKLVAQTLVDANFATLLLDLLTEEEEHNRRNVFDIGLLASRLVIAAKFVHAKMPNAKLMLFGASTGAGAALVAAANKEVRSLVAAVVSRGGRPELAQEHLPHVACPTLLIVGGNDEEVLELNQQAANRMRCHVQIKVVPGATHLFEEPGCLNQVAVLAKEWFLESAAKKNEQ